MCNFKFVNELSPLNTQVVSVPFGPVSNHTETLRLMDSPTCKLSSNKHPFFMSALQYLVSALSPVAFRLKKLLNILGKNAVFAFLVS